MDAELRAFYAGTRLAPVMGGQAFRQRMAQFLKGHPATPDVPDRKHIAPRPPIERIVQVTAAQFRVQPKALFRDGRGRGNLPRAIAMTLSRSPCGYPLREIARVFRVGSPSSISVAARRLRQHLADDRGLRRRVAQIRKELFTR